MSGAPLHQAADLLAADPEIIKLIGTKLFTKFYNRWARCCILRTAPHMGCLLQPAASAGVSQHQLSVLDLQALWRYSLQPWRTILFHGVRHLDPEVSLLCCWLQWWTGGAGSCIAQ